MICFESQRLYDQPELFHGAEGVPEGYYEAAIGEPDIKRAGDDLTILTVGATLYRALEAAKTLELNEIGVCNLTLDRAIAFAKRRLCCGGAV